MADHLLKDVFALQRDLYTFKGTGVKEQKYSQMDPLDIKAEKKQKIADAEVLSRRVRHHLLNPPTLPISMIPMDEDKDYHILPPQSNKYSILPVTNLPPVYEPNQDIGLAEGNTSQKHSKLARPSHLATVYDKNEEAQTPGSAGASGDARSLKNSTYLQFDSNFENGNLERVDRVLSSESTDYGSPIEEYYLTLTNDPIPNPRGWDSADGRVDMQHARWFNFRVLNAKANVTYKFKIINMTAPDSAFKRGMKPAVFSEKAYTEHGLGWMRLTEVGPIEYYPTASDADRHRGHGGGVTRVTEESSDCAHFSPEDESEAEVGGAGDANGEEGGTGVDISHNAVVSPGLAAFSPATSPHLVQAPMRNRDSIGSSFSPTLAGNNIGPGSLGVVGSSPRKQSTLESVAAPKSLSEADTMAEGPTASRAEVQQKYTLAFTFVHSTVPMAASETDALYISYAVPYTYTHLQSMLQNLIQDPVRSQHLKCRSLCTTEGGNRCDLAIITESQNPQLALLPEMNPVLGPAILAEQQAEERARKEKDEHIDNFKFSSIRHRASELVKGKGPTGGHDHSRTHSSGRSANLGAKFEGGGSAVAGSQAFSPGREGSRGGGGGVPVGRRRNNNAVGTIPDSHYITGKERRQRWEMRDYLLSTRKPVIVVTARTCPLDTVSSFACEGMIKFLVSNHEAAVKLRKSFVFMIVPMMNPDGVVNGYGKGNQNGVDLSHIWSRPSMHAHSSVYCLKELMNDLNQLDRLVSYLDLQGHSSKDGVFFSHCPAHPPPVDGDTDSEQEKEDEEEEAVSVAAPVRKVKMGTSEQVHDSSFVDIKTNSIQSIGSVHSALNYDPVVTHRYKKSFNDDWKLEISNFGDKMSITKRICMTLRNSVDPSDIIKEFIKICALSSDATTSCLLSLRDCLISLPRGLAREMYQEVKDTSTPATAAPTVPVPAGKGTAKEGSVAASSDPYAYFSYCNTKKSIGTGRVEVWKEYELSSSMAVLISFFRPCSHNIQGTHMDIRAHLDVSDYQRAGQLLCQALDAKMSDVVDEIVQAEVKDYLKRKHPVVKGHRFAAMNMTARQLYRSNTKMGQRDDKGRRGGLNLKYNSNVDDLFAKLKSYYVNHVKGGQDYDSSDEEKEKAREEARRQTRVLLSSRPPRFPRPDASLVADSLSSASLAGAGADSSMGDPSLCSDSVDSLAPGSEAQPSEYEQALSDLRSEHADQSRASSEAVVAEASSEQIVAAPAYSLLPINKKPKLLNIPPALATSNYRLKLAETNVAYSSITRDKYSKAVTDGSDKMSCILVRFPDDDSDDDFEHNLLSDDEEEVGTGDEEMQPSRGESRSGSAKTSPRPGTGAGVPVSRPHSQSIGSANGRRPRVRLPTEEDNYFQDAHAAPNVATLQQNNSNPEQRIRNYVAARGKSRWQVLKENLAKGSGSSTISHSQHVKNSKIRENWQEAISMVKLKQDLAAWTENQGLTIGQGRGALNSAPGPETENGGRVMTARTAARPWSVADNARTPFHSQDDILKPPPPSSEPSDVLGQDCGSVSDMNDSAIGSTCSAFLANLTDQGGNMLGMPLDEYLGFLSVQPAGVGTMGNKVVHVIPSAKSGEPGPAKSGEPSPEKTRVLEQMETETVDPKCKSDAGTDGVVVDETGPESNLEADTADTKKLPILVIEGGVDMRALHAGPRTASPHSSRKESLVAVVRETETTDAVTEATGPGVNSDSILRGQSRPKTTGAGRKVSFVGAGADDGINKPSSAAGRSKVRSRPSFNSATGSAAGRPVYDHLEGPGFDADETGAHSADDEEEANKGFIASVRNRLPGSYFRRAGPGLLTNTESPSPAVATNSVVLDFSPVVSTSISIGSSRPTSVQQSRSGSGGAGASTPTDPSVGASGAVWGREESSAEGRDRSPRSQPPVRPPSDATRNSQSANAVVRPNKTQAPQAKPQGSSLREGSDTVDDESVLSLPEFSSGYGIKIGSSLQISGKRAGTAPSASAAPGLGLGMGLEPESTPEAGAGLDQAAGAPHQSQQKSRQHGVALTADDDSLEFSPTGDMLTMPSPVPRSVLYCTDVEAFTERKLAPGPQGLRTVLIGTDLDQTSLDSSSAVSASTVNGDYRHPPKSTSAGSSRSKSKIKDPDKDKSKSKGKGAIKPKGCPPVGEGNSSKAPPTARVTVAPAPGAGTGAGAGEGVEEVGKGVSFFEHGLAVPAAAAAAASVSGELSVHPLGSLPTDRLLSLIMTQQLCILEDRMSPTSAAAAASGPSSGSRSASPTKEGTVLNKVAVELSSPVQHTERHGFSHNVGDEFTPAFVPVPVAAGSESTTVEIEPMKPKGRPSIHLPTTAAATSDSSGKISDSVSSLPLVPVTSTSGALLMSGKSSRADDLSATDTTDAVPAQPPTSQLQSQLQRVELVRRLRPGAARSVSFDIPLDTQEEDDLVGGSSLVDVESYLREPAPGAVVAIKAAPALSGDDATAIPTAAGDSVGGMGAIETAFPSSALTGGGASKPSRPKPTFTSPRGYSGAGASGPTTVSSGLSVGSTASAGSAVAHTKDLGVGMDSSISDSISVSKPPLSRLLPAHQTTGPSPADFPIARPLHSSLVHRRCVPKAPEPPLDFALAGAAPPVGASARGAKRTRSRSSGGDRRGSGMHAPPAVAAAADDVPTQRPVDTLLSILKKPKHSIAGSGSGSSARGSESRGGSRSHGGASRAGVGAGRASSPQRPIESDELSLPSADSAREAARTSARMVPLVASTLHPGSRLSDQIGEEAWLNPAV